MIFLSIVYQPTVCSSPSPSIDGVIDSYRPSLPQRGRVPEPHYSVPKNNTRVSVPGEEKYWMVRITGAEVDKMASKAEEEVDIIVHDAPRVIEGKKEVEF